MYKRTNDCYSKVRKSAERYVVIKFCDVLSLSLEIRRFNNDQSGRTYQTKHPSFQKGSTENGTSSIIMTQNINNTKSVEFQIVFC